MSSVEIYRFNVYPKNGLPSIGAHVFMKSLPLNSTATVHSTVEFGCSWYIVYSVQSSYQTEFFYELVQDLNKSNEYVLNVSYDSSRAICSFKPNDKIKFVDPNNKELADQNQKFFFECERPTDFKCFLVVSANNVVLFWNDDDEEVRVKTLNLQSFDSFEEYDFTRVNYDINLYNDTFSLTFYTDPSAHNTYYSLQLTSNSFFESSKVKYVFNEHCFDQPSHSLYNCSQFEQDTEDDIQSGFLVMSYLVDGEELLEDDSDEDDSDEDDSDEDDS